MKKFLTIFLFVSYNIFSFNINIPTNVLENKLNEFFPIEKNLFKNNIVLENPKILIENGDIKLKTDYEAKILGKHFIGNMLLKTNLVYKKNTGELYLSNLSLEEITNRNDTYKPQNSLIFNKILNKAYDKIEKISIFNTKKHSLTNLINIHDISIVKDKLLIIF